MKIKLFGLVLTLLSAVAMGQVNVYVNPSGASTNPGDDTRSYATAQNPATPWATPNGANSKLAAQFPATLSGGVFVGNGSLPTGGIVVNVGAGTYNQCVSTQVTGTASKRIVWQGAANYSSRIVCPASSTLVWANGTGANNRAADYVSILGFEITGNPTTSVCEGISSFGAFALIQGNWIHDILGQNSTTCGTQGGGGIVLRNNGAPATVAHDSIVNGNIIDQIGRGDDGVVGDNSQTIHGIYQASPRHTITNNIVSRAAAWGIHLFHDVCQSVVSNNTLINNYRGGIIVSAGDTNSSGSNQTCANSGAAFTNDFTSVFNNIVAHNGGGGGGSTAAENGIEERYGPTGANNIYRNNSFWNNLPGNYNFANGARTNTGTITTNSDSIFVHYTGNAKTGDYHLTANVLGAVGSCAVAPGFTPCTPTKDLSGANRNAFTPTVGAFEFGTSVGPGTLQVAPTSLPFGTITVGQASAISSVTVTNTSTTGTVTLSNPASTVTGNTADFPFGGSGTCAIGSVLAANGGRCTVSNFCQPTTTGLRSANLNIFSNATNGTIVVPMSCTGQAPAVPHFTPPAPPIAFGSQNVFTNTLPQNYTVTSDGNATLSVTGLSISNSIPVVGIDDFPSTDLVTGCNPSGTQHWCGTHDAGTPGTASGTSALVTTPAVDGQSRQFVPSGTAFGGFRYSTWLGNGAANAAPTVFVYDFRIEFTSALTHVTNLEFDHNQSIADTNLVIFGVQCNMTAGLWQITGQNPSSPTNSQWFNTSATCTRAQWTLNTFHHVTMVYHRDANGNVTYDNITFDGATQNIGVTLPSLFILAGWPQGTYVENVQFDGDNSAWTVTAYMDSFSLTGYQDFYPQSTGTCGAVPFNVAAGSFCNIPMIMNPSATGSVAGSVVLSSNSAGSPTTTALSGSATQPNATLTSPVSFGNVLLGTPSSSQPAVLANTGTGPLTVNPPTITAPFTQTNSCGTFPLTIAPGGQCTFNVVCTPNVVGNINGQLTVTDNAPTPTQISALSCTGTAPATNGVKFSGGVTMSGGVRLLQPGGP